MHSTPAQRSTAPAPAPASAPRPAQAPRAVAGTGARADAGAANGRLRAFLVEDSAVIRDNLIATLDEMSAVSIVGCASDEAGALAWLARTDHDAVALLIVDLFLAGGSGLGVLRGVAAHRPALKPALHVVVLSNYATPELRRKCLELGADRVFDKSTEIDALIAWCAHLATPAAAPTTAAAPMARAGRTARPS